MSSILKVDTIQNTGGNDLITTASNTTSIKNPNGTTGLTIDSSGRMKLPNQIVFSAHNVSSSNGTVNNTYDTNLLFSTIVSNDGNHFNNSTGYFTCPLAGNYECYMNVNWNGHNNWMGLYINHNNTMLVQSWKKDVVNFEYLSNVAHTIVSCSANDTLSFSYRNNYTKPSSGANYNNCFIKFLG